MSAFFRFCLLFSVMRSKLKLSHRTHASSLIPVELGGYSDV